ncbi:MAG TPA: cysteine peptidase family C39 domain-containing protein [Pirellulales bacterium]|nr:cysteine peptidase family C39 domain-containing protein [Pirellulales bacterium]
MACLRMVLAACGTVVAERDLEDEARMEVDGTDIGELERLARQFGLAAEIQEPNVNQLGQLLADGKLPIAYIDRAVFELTPAARDRHSLRNARIHTVIPTRVSKASIWYHDPMQPRPVRKSIRLFRLAYERLGGRSVVCWKAASA